MAVAVAALMVFAASAFATTLTSPTGTTYTSTFKAVVDSNEKAVSPTFDGSFTTITCKKSTIEGKIERHGHQRYSRWRDQQMDVRRMQLPDDRSGQRLA
jgi:hypothetical protein